VESDLPLRAPKATTPEAKIPATARPTTSVRATCRLYVRKRRCAAWLLLEGGSSDR
jgi:hypothetical protein